MEINKQDLHSRFTESTYNSKIRAALDRCRIHVTAEQEIILMTTANNGIHTLDLGFKESILSFLEDVWLYIVMKDGEIKNMDPEHFRKMSWVMDVRKKAISYQAHRFITKEEKARLIQLSEASLEDLVVAQDIVRNFEMLNHTIGL